jgi:hypothetical protein
VAAHLDSAEQALRVSSTLDARYHWLKGDGVVTDKDRAFRELFRILEASGTRYALIGGVAVQLWRSEPRTTLDIDVAVADYEDLPKRVLAEAGFRFLARHVHSENWMGPGEIPVQFTSDPSYGPAIEGAIVRTLTEGSVRVSRPLDLVRSKLKAASDPARRRSKRLMDLADAQALVEDDPGLSLELSAEERGQLAGGF